VADTRNAINDLSCFPYLNYAQSKKRYDHKPEGKGQLGIPMHKRNDNIKTDFKELRLRDED